MTGNERFTDEELENARISGERHAANRVRADAMTADAVKEAWTGRYASEPKTPWWRQILIRIGLVNSLTVSGHQVHTTNIFVPGFVLSGHPTASGDEAAAHIFSTPAGDLRLAVVRRATISGTELILSWTDIPERIREIQVSFLNPDTQEPLGEPLPLVVNRRKLSAVINAKSRTLCVDPMTEAWGISLTVAFSDAD